MEASLSSSPPLRFQVSSPVQWRSTVKKYSRSTVRLNPTKRPIHLIGNQRLLTTRIAAVNDVSSAAGAEITWQIVVGAIAGVTPFMVAGIEFSKRIVAQRRCEACGGSGLVLRDNHYFRCPQCGGFLPWQSWKRFFMG